MANTGGVTNFDKINPSYEASTAVSNAVTTNKQSGVVTTENLSTATNATYTLTMTNATIGAAPTLSDLMLTVGFGSATVGTPVLQSVVITEDTAVIKIINIGPALNGTLKIPFWVLNPDSD